MHILENAQPHSAADARASSEPVRLAGVVPFYFTHAEYVTENLRFYVMRPHHKHAHLPPPLWQIAKGTRYICIDGHWRDTTPEDIPLLQRLHRQSDTRYKGTQPHTLPADTSCEDLLDTALREAEEELGLHPHHIAQWFDAGCHRFTSVQAAANASAQVSTQPALYKKMWLFAGEVTDPDLLAQSTPSSHSTQACRWYSVKAFSADGRDDHASILQTIAQRLTAWYASNVTTI